VCRQSSSVQSFIWFCQRGIEAVDLGAIGQTCSAEFICRASHSIRTVSHSIRIVVRNFPMRRSYREFPFDKDFFSLMLLPAKCKQIARFGMCALRRSHCSIFVPRPAYR
jgi:hypothetical protein